MEARVRLAQIEKRIPGLKVLRDYQRSWLPATESGFYRILRLYATKPKVLAGKLSPPVRRIKKLARE